MTPWQALGAMLAAVLLYAGGRLAVVYFRRRPERQALSRREIAERRSE